jgi:hypothetical protein
MISQEMNTPRAEQQALEVDEHNREALAQVMSPPSVDFQSERAKSLEEIAKKEVEGRAGRVAPTDGRH